MQKEFFGQYLISKGIINALQLTKAIKLQESSNRELGQLAEENHLLSSEQVRQILSFQMRKDIYFGQAAKELGLLKEEEVEMLLRQQKERHLFLGDALVKLGYLTEEGKNKALEKFLKEEKMRQQSIIKEVPSELKSVKELLDKICLHAIKVLRRLSGVSAKCSNYKFKDKEISLDEISVEVSFEGNLSRHLLRFSLALSQEMAKTITTKTYQKSGFPTEDENNESIIDKNLAGDVIGEITNIIAGQVCNEFSPQELGPGIPYVKYIKEGESFRRVLSQTEKAASISLITPFQPLCIYLILADNLSDSNDKPETAPPDK
ncbi:MAG: hypothetical protein J7J25_01615 [Candidatus Omnitrophica bacterium]|nr:hypothetical protein [Candidatus Omnitrophota bacterium]